MWNGTPEALTITGCNLNPGVDPEYTIVTDWNPITMRYEGKDYFNGVETGSFVCFTKTPPGNTPFMFGECISASCPFIQQTCDGVQAPRSFLYCGGYCTPSCDECAMTPLPWLVDVPTICYGP